MGDGAFSKFTDSRLVEGQAQLERTAAPEILESRMRTLALRLFLYSPNRSTAPLRATGLPPWRS
jgi:hypothetical protein